MTVYRIRDKQTEREINGDDLVRDEAKVPNGTVGTLRLWKKDANGKRVPTLKHIYVGDQIAETELGKLAAQDEHDMKILLEAHLHYGYGGTSRESVAGWENTGGFWADIYSPELAERLSS